MTKFFNKYKILIAKYSDDIDDFNKLSSPPEEIQEKFDKVKEAFNKEFSFFLNADDEYLFEFIGSNLNVLKKHIHSETKDIDAQQQKVYVELLKEKLQYEFNHKFLHAQKYLEFLDKSSPYYFLKAINNENLNLLRHNIQQKDAFLIKLLKTGFISIELRNKSNDA